MDIVQGETGCRWRWHDLRAAFITHGALTSGAVTAQVLARHSNFETTQAYIDVADEARRIAAERTAERPALLDARKSLTMPVRDPTKLPYVLEISGTVGWARTTDLRIHKIGLNS